MKKIMIFLGLLVCTTYFNCCGTNRTLAEKEIKSKIDNYLQIIMNKFNIPGLACAVTKDGEIIYMNTFGVTNVNTREQLQSKHIFHMASVSKPFVATAIMQLVERGKMDLDDPLVKYLPYFKLDDERYQKITIRQMLNHTSGMPDVVDYEWDHPQYDEGAAERYIRGLETEKMIGAPGENYQYSNMAYDVLGDVIAKISGIPFESYMKENILNPIGMKESSFLFKQIKKELLTTPHIWYLEPLVSDIYPYNRPHAPSSTLNSNVIEMIKWANVNLNHGELNGKRIISEAGHNLLWGRSVPLSEKTSIGLGWILSEYHGLFTVGHSGDDVGYCSDFKLIPEKKIGIIMASNYDLTPISLILDGVSDILLGFEPEIPKKSVLSYFRRIMDRDGIEAAKAAYYTWYNESRDEYNFGPDTLNSLGYKYIRKQELNNALKVFLFNVELYPNNSSVYDSLAEVYRLNGDLKLAIDTYKKSLDLNPDNAQAKEMLIELEKIK